MCNICGCGIDIGSTESMFSKNYSCLECGKTFKGFGVMPQCQFCGSRKVKRQMSGVR